MSEPWERYQDLLRQQNRGLQRSDFLIDSDSNDSVHFGTGTQEEDDPQPSTSGVSPNPSTSGIKTSTREQEDGPNPSTSGVWPSTSSMTSAGQDQISDSEISDLSSSFGNDEPAIRHFHNVTSNLNQAFIPVTELRMPTSKKRANSPSPQEPTKKRKKNYAW